VGVPQIMKSDPRQPGSLDDGVELPPDEVLGVERIPVGLAENEVAVFVVHPQDVPAFFLLVSQLAQLINQHWIQLNHAPGQRRSPSGRTS